MQKSFKSFDQFVKKDLNSGIKDESAIYVLIDFLAHDI